MSYEKLFTPGSIGNLELKNRIVMPAMGCSLAESTGEAGARMIKYYADRARGGAGLIITEITRVDDETGVGTPNQLSVTKPSSPAWRKRSTPMIPKSLSSSIIPATRPPAGSLTAGSPFRHRMSPAMSSGSSPGP